MDFTAIDFETANGHATSACSIGMAIVENSAVAEVRHFLIKPEPYYFSRFNTAIHGITAGDVRDAPTFGELWPTLAPYIANRVVAAHFAPFDLSVLRGTLGLYAIRQPDMGVLCSCSLAKAAYPQLPSHSLDVVCGYLGIPLRHHRADSDAAGSAEIILQIAAGHGISRMEDFQQKLHVIPGFVKAERYKPCRPQTCAPGIPAECPCEAFFNKDFVFSGSMESMTRKKAYEVVQNGGGFPQKSVTQATDYLVVGAQPSARPASAKMRKALELQKQGFAVQIIDEGEFGRMIPPALHDACFPPR